MSLILKYTKTSENAIIPTRTHPSDIGLDLSAISYIKNLNSSTILLETGLIVNPPEGYYVEIVSRSSLSKSYWMLANSIGIIDPNYRDSLKIALTLKQTNDSLETLTNKIEYPFRCCQIILRKIEYVELEESNIDVNTDRGLGCFGSSDKVKDGIVLK